MLPRAILYLEKIPLTIKGKLDYKALPKSKFENCSSNYISPITKAERIICTAFSRVLKLDKVSVDADFFKLGGIHYRSLF